MLGYDQPVRAFCNSPYMDPVERTGTKHVLDHLPGFKDWFEL